MRSPIKAAFAAEAPPHRFQTMLNIRMRAHPSACTPSRISRSGLASGRASAANRGFDRRAHPVVHWAEDACLLSSLPGRRRARMEAVAQRLRVRRRQGRGRRRSAHSTHKGRQTSCTETYAQILLIDLANHRKADAAPDRAHFHSGSSAGRPRSRSGRAPAAQPARASHRWFVRSRGCCRASRRMPEGRHDHVSRLPRSSGGQRAQAHRVAAQGRDPRGARTGRGRDRPARRKPAHHAVPAMVRGQAIARAPAPQRKRHRTDLLGDTRSALLRDRPRVRSPRAPRRYPRCSTSRLRRWASRHSPRR